MRLSVHVCSNWAGALCLGKVPRRLELEQFSRVQLNIARYLGDVESPEVMVAGLPAG
jgi:hypothetical protein